ncbi:DUF1294 domain-containing protein [Inhella crocodyli]|uniref:DUF1294 domain-containing protein n=1 Tax=Inhella crocodyli TaxID=2499851 RepID=A0A3S2XWX5_9BURK|nr:DUF1294 domain-containing protein [Inhella crocodyli]RVT88385.1 DUF1294 domain-containing protein [Inhella crocodyli]
MNKPRPGSSAQALGRVSHWDAAKGLGFVQPDAGGERLVLRRADLAGRLKARGNPDVGEPVRYTPRDGMAKGVHSQRASPPASAPPGARPRASRPAAAPNSARLLVIPAFGLLLGAIHMSWPLPRLVTTLYGALSTALFIVYGMDKWAAKRGRARVAESSLHLIALLGGWPGALLGQQVFRHKTAKPAFLRWTWAMVALNLLALVWIVTPAGWQAIAVLRRLVAGG